MPLFSQNYYWWTIKVFSHYHYRQCCYKYPWAYNLTNGAFISRKHRFPSSEIAGSKIILFSYILAGYIPNSLCFQPKQLRYVWDHWTGVSEVTCTKQKPQEIQGQPEESPQRAGERKYWLLEGRAPGVSIQTWAALWPGGGTGVQGMESSGERGRGWEGMSPSLGSLSE